MNAIAPMLCGSWTPPDEGQPLVGRPGYAYEIKWDGYRLQTIKVGESVRVLFGRSANDVTEQFPEIADAVRRIPVDCVIDGEAIVLRNGWPHFQDFQNRMGMSAADRAEKLRFVVFDMMRFGETDVTKFPYSERRKALEKLVEPAAPVLMMGPSSTDADKMWKFVLKHDLEGLIAKPLASRYLPGERGTWVKIKRTITEEFVIYGYVPGTGKWTGWFGSLYIAEPEGDKIRPVGAVGTGFNETQQADLFEKLQLIRRETISEQITEPPKDKGVLWVEPEIRIRVAYQERTDIYNTLRGPAAFKGLA